MSGLRLVGRVLFWVEVRGYGFIRATDGRSYFCHVSETENRQGLARGQLVAFTPAEHPKGLQAGHVALLPGSCPKCEEPLRSLTCGSCGFTLSP